MFWVAQICAQLRRGLLATRQRHCLRPATMTVRFWLSISLIAVYRQFHCRSRTTPCLFPFTWDFQREMGNENSRSRRRALVLHTSASVTVSYSYSYIGTILGFALWFRFDWPNPLLAGWMYRTCRQPARQQVRMSYREYRRQRYCWRRLRCQSVLTEHWSYDTRLRRHGRSAMDGHWTALLFAVKSTRFRWFPV